MAETAAGGMETPKEKKSRVLKRIKKKKQDLNISSTKKKKPFSYGRSNISLSTSIQKQSLRANNKALAFNLERTREALRIANDANLELQQANQEQHMKLTTLQRVAGLKDEDIESEVKTRLKKHMSDLKTKMVSMRRLFYDAFACMDEVTDMCNSLSHRASQGQRQSSIGSSVGDTSLPHGAYEGLCRSLFSQISKQGFPSMLPRQTEPGPETSSAVSCDMSMIAETSVLLEDITPPSDLVPHIADIQEAENESKSPMPAKTSGNCVKLAPQRVLKESNLPSPLNVGDVGETKVSSPTVKNKKLDRRGTFVLNTNVADGLPSKSTLSKQESSETESIKPVKNSSNKDQQREDSARVDSSSKVPSPETKSPEICQNEAPKSPKNTAKARSRSKGRLTKAESTTKACADSPSIPDRRKTFVLPKSVPVQEPKLPFSSKSSECLHPDHEKSLETADDRRKTYLLPPAVSQSTSNQSLSPNLASYPEDVTQCFSMDMEMTEVIDSTQLIQLEKPEQNQLTLENSKSKPGKEIPKALATDSISLLPNSSDSSDSEALSKPASVEFRIPRPGKIVFSASRKEVDGSRKPVPSKLPLKARSKSKIKLSRSKGRRDIVPESPKEVKSIFDFHDRTPRGKEDSTKTSGSIYDLSMNESLREPISKPSLSQFRRNNEKELKGKDGSKETDIKLLPNNPVYYQPLKECSPEPPVQKRSRSKSRTRKGEPEDENESRSSRARSRSRRRDEMESTEKQDENVPKSRARSRSRRRGETESTEKDDEVENIPKSRGRSRSRRRGEAESTEKDDEFENIPKSRGRSRSRRRGEAESTEKDDEVENIPKLRGRSRSRRRGEAESTEKDDEVENIPKSRARSRSRRRDETESTEKDDEDGTCARPRGRPRKRRSSADVELEGSSVSRGDEIEADSCTSRGRSRTIRRNYAEESDDSEENERKGHAQSKNRKTEEEYKVHIKPRTRSRSRRRKEPQEDANEAESNAGGVMKEPDSDSIDNLPQSDSSTEGHRSRSRSIKRKTHSDNNEESQIRSLKNRTRSRSRHCKNVVEDGEIEDDSSDTTVESRNLVTTESNIEKDITCPGREDVATGKSDCGDNESTSRSRSKASSNMEEEDGKKSRGRSRSPRRKNTVNPETGTPKSTKKSKSLHVEDTPDMAARKSKDVDFSENEKKGDYQQSRSRARSRTRKNKERDEEEDGEDFKQGTGSRKKVLKEKRKVLKSDSDDDDDDVKKVSKRSEIPVSESEAVLASSGDEKSEEEVPNSEELNLTKTCGDGVIDDDVEESIIIVPSPPKSIKLKAKKKLSLNKKENSSKSGSLDVNRKSNTGESEDMKERDVPSEKKSKNADKEIPRLADGLFITKRGRSLKSGRQTADDHDLDFDFDCLSHNDNAETSKLPKTPSVPASDGETKSTASPQLKKLKSVKKSTKKRRRSIRNSLSEDPQMSLLKTPAAESERTSDKENDRSGVGLTEQLQNIRKKLASLDKRQSKSSLGSQPVANSFDFSKMDMGSNEPETKRPRRGAAPVSLKEMSLNQKMRREDFEVPKSASKPSSNTSTPLKKKL